MMRISNYIVLHTIRKKNEKIRKEKKRIEKIIRLASPSQQSRVGLNSTNFTKKVATENSKTFGNFSINIQ